MQVTAYGAGNSLCKSEGWGSSDGLALQVWVGCYTASGAPIKSLFTAQFVQRQDQPGPESAYVWAYDSSNASYTAVGPNAWNSTGGSINITHEPGSGHYAVTLSGQDGSLDFEAGVGDCHSDYGTAEVTAFGSDNNYCKVINIVHHISAKTATVNVQCFNGSTHATAEAVFSLVYGTLTPNDTYTAAFAWADQPTASSYSANPNYTNGDLQAIGDGNTLHCVGGPVTVSRLSTGLYTVDFPGLMGNQITSQSAQTVKVTGYGGYADNCKVVNWWGSAPGTTDAIVEVACFAPGGIPGDAMFMVTYSSFGYLAAS